MEKGIKVVLVIITMTLLFLSLNKIKRWLENKGYLNDNISEKKTNKKVSNSAKTLSKYFHLGIKSKQGKNWIYFLYVFFFCFVLSALNPLDFKSDGGEAILYSIVAMLICYVGARYYNHVDKEK